MNEIECLRKDATYEIYRTSCDCLSEDHVVTLFFEEENGIKSMNFSYKAYLKGWMMPREFYDNRFKAFIGYLKYLFDCFCYRLKMAIRVLFKGYVEMDADLFFRDDKQILALVETMLQFVLKPDPPKPNDE